jgi:hypothetical protein
VEPLLLGQVFYKLEPLAFLIDNPTTISIIGQNLQVMGKLEVNIIPVDEDGESEIPDDLIPEEPEDLIGKRIDFIIEIKQATGLPKNFCRDVYCEYKFFLFEEVYQSAKILGKD